MNEDVKITPKADKPLFHNKSEAGKGDSPRNISQKYRDNWEEIKGFKKSKYK